GLIVPVCLLLSTRWMPREASAWLATAGALLCGLLMPPFLAVIAVMAAITLALRALRKPTACDEDESHEFDEIDSAPVDAESFGFAPRPERMRLLVGSTSVTYLSVWTLGWPGGALPEHVFWLDGMLTVALLALVWGFRAYVALLPLASSYLHLGVQAGTLSLPRTRAQWGLAEVGLGFALLATAVLTSWYSSREQAPDDSSLEGSLDERDPP